MKKINMAVAVLMTLGLAACGGSGGGNTSSSPNTQINTPPQQLTPAPETPKSETVATTDAGVTIERVSADGNHFNKQYPFTGAGYSVPKTPGEVLIVSRYNEKSADETDLRVLYIDDKVFNIFPSSTAKTIHLTSSNMTRIAQQGQNATIAIVTETDTPYYIVLNSINPTKDTSTLNGTFNYRGTGYHSYANDGAKNPNELTDSVVDLTANFNEKFIKGTISSPKDEFKTLEIGGYITNNGFQGKVNQTELKGGFFGSEAQEAAGYYINRDAADPSYGVFNTTKQ